MQDGFSTILPASPFCQQVRGRLRLRRPLKEFGPERATVLGGGGPEGPGNSHLSRDTTHASQSG